MNKDKETILKMMKERDFILCMEEKNYKGDIIAYDFISKPVRHRHQKDVIVVPPFNCTIYPNTGEFQFTYIIPNDMNILTSPKSGSVQIDDHFYNICIKFERIVQILYQTFGDE